jgi:hypothetical protein
MSDFVKATSATDKTCLTNGLTLIAGGTGIADITIGTPQPGHRAVIRIASLTSGSVVVTCAGTFDGTNNTATFDAAGEALSLVYNDSDSWAIELNVGGVALSAV